MSYQLLEKYIHNESVLRAAEVNHELEKEHIYSMTYPQFDNSLGYIEYSSLRIDKAVIDVIELENYHQMNYKEHYKTRALLNKSLEVLNGEELEVYNAIVWNRPSNINKARLMELEPIVVQKLCDYFSKKNERNELNEHIAIVNDR